MTVDVVRGHGLFHWLLVISDEGKFVNCEQLERLTAQFYVAVGG